MIENKTIAAIATPLGEGGISIVRVSGPLSKDIFKRIFRRKTKGKIVSHKLYYGDIIEDDVVHDKAMAALMLAPNSYTREDVLELHCHGGVNIPVAVLMLTLKLGAHLAEPGEFTKRAFLNGRIDLAQAEAVMNMITATSDAASRAALRQLEGGLSKAIQKFEDRLTNCLAQIEAWLDFPDEIDEDVTSQSILSEIDGLLYDLEKEINGKAGKYIYSGINVVIAGQPNVGKSSLLNALLGHNRAIVTSIAGTTRDVLTESLILDGMKVNISDTAGQRETEDIVEVIGVQRAKEAMETADMVLLVLDGSRPLSEYDRELLKAHFHHLVILVNKCDMPQQLSLKEIVSMQRVLHISCKTMFGIESVLEEISNFAKTECGDQPFITSKRHVESANLAIGALKTSRESLVTNIPLDIVAIDLKVAHLHLGEITGRGLDSDIIDRIFQNFCVGK